METLIPIKLTVIITVYMLDSATSDVVESAQSILHVNGLCTVTFDTVLIGHSYYIDICHRSCIQTMSANPVTVSPVTNYDFSTGVTLAYSDGFNLPMVEVEAGVWAFYSGDINHDCTIDPLDVIVVDNENQSGILGYACTDLNGDGYVDTQDVTICDNNSFLGIFCAYPGNIPSSCDCNSGNPCANINTDDGNACTTDACDPSTGNITHTPISVDDNNACTTDACDPVTGPSHTPISCDDNNVCTTDGCDPVTGCFHNPISADDNNACTTDACDPVTGPSHTPISCDDNNVFSTDGFLVQPMVINAKFFK